MCEFATLQKTITCTKKSRKGEIKWHKAFVEVELLARKQKKKKRKKRKTPMKTRFASKVVLFQVMALTHSIFLSFALYFMEEF